MKPASPSRRSADSRTAITRGAEVPCAPSLARSASTRSTSSASRQPRSASVLSRASSIASSTSSMRSSTGSGGSLGTLLSETCWRVSSKPASVQVAPQQPRPLRVVNGRVVQRLLEPADDWFPDRLGPVVQAAVDHPQDRMLHPVSLNCAACIPTAFRDERLGRRPSPEGATEPRDSFGHERTSLTYSSPTSLLTPRPFTTGSATVVLTRHLVQPGVLGETTSSTEVRK